MALADPCCDFVMTRLMTFVFSASECFSYPSTNSGFCSFSPFLFWFLPRRSNLASIRRMARRSQTLPLWWCSGRAAAAAGVVSDLSPVLIHLPYLCSTWWLHSERLCVVSGATASSWKGASWKWGSSKRLWLSRPRKMGEFFFLCFRPVVSWGERCRTWESLVDSNSQIPTLNTERQAGR